MVGIASYIALGCLSVTLHTYVWGLSAVRATRERFFAGPLCVPFYLAMVAAVRLGPYRREVGVWIDARRCDRGQWYFGCVVRTTTGSAYQAIRKHSGRSWLSWVLDPYPQGGTT